MTEKREYHDYIDDIVDSIEKIEEFIKEMNYDTFVRDSKTIFAVIRALEVIGEAVSKIPEEIRSNYPSLPWREMTDMRNKLIHEYFGVKLRVVWKTVTEDIPTVKPVFLDIQKNLNQ